MKQHASIIMAALAVLAAIVHAQPPRMPMGPPPGNQGPPGKCRIEQGKPDGNAGAPPMFAVIDADKDGVISKRELRKAGEALLKFDVNGDGEISLDEVPRPPKPQAPTEGEESDGMDSEN